MGEKLIVMHSLTYAYKAQDILKRHHIHAKIVQTPKELSKNGCGYSLAVNGDVDFILKLLKQSGIPV